MDVGIVPKFRPIAAVVLVSLTACNPQGPPGADVRSEAAETGSGEGLSHDGRCDEGPVPRIRPGVRAVAFPRGDGPVFVGLGTGRVVHYAEDTRQHAGWHYYKTLWAVSPAYAGAVTITGLQVDGGRILRFNPGASFPGRKEKELRFPAQQGEDWRYGPSETLFEAPGCYAFEVEGDGFRYAIMFQAQP
jgi:hypothetical protein